MLINEINFKNILNNQLSSETIKNTFIENFKSLDSHDIFIKYANLLSNEDIPLNTSVINENFNLLINDYNNGVLNQKTIFLNSDYNIKVFIGKEGKISYRDADNLNNEVSEILKLYKFINDDGDIIFLKSKNASEYLTINGEPANMFSEDIEFYSSLLNYTKNEIENSKGLKTILGDIYSNNKENWDKYHEYFQKFLEDLKKRTINY